MNVAVFKEAQEAYARGDYETALDDFIECVRDTNDLSPSDLSKFYHLIGNCYVKNGNPREAASAYTHALKCSPEKRKPSLYVNLGTALLGTKDYKDALTAFTRALDYPIYATPYKAYAGIGAAQLKLGNMTEAGAAYREAALDPTNPEPAKSLVNLGVCFMELGRAKDAVTSYETALEFNLTPAASARAHANLGQAYLAQGRVNKAIEAFEAATADGFELSPMASHDYEIARALHDKIESRVPGVLDTGFLPNVAMVEDEKDAVDEPSEMPLDASGHLPVYGEPNFDPFAPQTQSMDAVKADQLPPVEEAEEPETDEEENADAPEEALEAASDAGRASARGVLRGSGAKSASSAIVAAPASERVREPQVRGSEPGPEPETKPSSEESARGRKRAPHVETRKVSVDGVDEDELERTLIELGIAPDQEHSLWAEEEEPEVQAQPSTDELAPELYVEPDYDEAETPAAGEDRDIRDLSTEKTELIPAISPNSELDIPTGEMSRVGSGQGGNAEEAEADTTEELDDLDKTVPTAPVSVPEDNDETGADEPTQEFAPQPFVSDVIDSGEPLKADDTDTHMPSPEDTQFFEVSEEEIDEGAKRQRKKARKSRGVGLKVAIAVVILAVLVAAAGAAAYIMGYGYPTQEHVTRSFFAAVHNGTDTSEYWADDVSESSREAQTASLQQLNSYNVEAVQRSMSQTAVYVKGTLEEGGQIDYQVVLNRKGLSWAIEYVELYFPSQQ